MAFYSEKVMDHFMNPRNVGEIESPDGVGEVGNPTCGDMMTFMIKVEGDRLTEVKFRTFGCGAAIAVSSMISEMATGKTLDEAMQITNAQVAEELDGLPGHKMHCSNLGADALHKAIEDYRARLETGEPAKVPQEREVEKTDHNCPYCEAKVEDTADFCKACKAEFTACPHCGKIADRSREECPHCGARLES
ncbi:MAG TPA: Fe-S cluster assembly scaffold protein NifU [Candidatus Krumholzibacterium sp.]|nr:Fe-S cluster assembly scaffold protein NifU [Candidatus Krumholzibacterium sp.]